MPTPAGDICSELASTPWPPQRHLRQALLRRMDALTHQCAASPAFLGLIGALWLEEGEPAQALIWLERAILLDPEALGVLADHALALAALGEPDARLELLSRWAARTDVPPALMARLSNDTRAPVIIPGQGANGGRWLQRSELQLRVGYDNNLDRSPVLDSVTLTQPDGPVEVPLAIPLRPRPGAAGLLDLGWRLAYETGDGALWQVAASGAARSAVNESSTDWHYLQLRGEYWRTWGIWRTQVQLGLSGSGGPLNEPYRLQRVGMALERDGNQCTWRTGLDFEGRRQRTSSYLDGDVTGGHLSAHCRLGAAPGAGNWTIGVEARLSRDRPSQDRQLQEGAPPGGPTQSPRPGGAQKQAGLTATLAGRIGPVRIEANASAARSRDEEGYSEAFNSNARRVLRIHQFGLEVAIPVGNGSIRGDLIGQVNTSVQASNIPLFANRGSNAYLGWRWRW